jgi:cell shape-determining protein MreC
MNSHDIISYLENAVKTTPYDIEKQRLKLAIAEIKKLTMEVEMLTKENKN